MRPASAFKYIKENKGRSLIIIFMLFLTVMLNFAGNYVHSMDWFWQKAYEYDKKEVMISAITSDEDFRDFYAIMEDLKADDELIVLQRSSRGFTGLDWKCTLGFEMGSVSYVVDNKDDLAKLFDRLGIKCDLTNVRDGSVIMSRTLADNRNLKPGDVIDASVDSSISGRYTFDAVIDDGSFILFYVQSDPDNSLRAYVMSEKYEGQELRSKVSGIIGERKAKMSSDLEQEVGKQFQPFYILFIAGIVLISVMLSVTVNSVLTGHYNRRLYEFGIYRALGWNKGSIFRKVFCEIMVMDLAAVAAGAVITLMLTFLLNELMYLPEGKFLPYWSVIGIGGALLSNLLVVIPSVIFKGRRMTGADITEF